MYISEKEKFVKIQLVPAMRLLENESEIARLMSLHQNLSMWTGGALPPTLDVSKVKRVLDIGCGVGAWVHEVARDYPQTQVVGIDSNPRFYRARKSSSIRDA